MEQQPQSPAQKSPQDPPPSPQWQPQWQPPQWQHQWQQQGQQAPGAGYPGWQPARAPLPGEIRQRLHPLSPLLRGFRFSLIIVAAFSWQAFTGLGPQRWAMGVLVIAAIVLAGSLVSYLVTGYQVVGRELRIDEGVLFRRTRAIPVERLQSVELVQSLLARMLGLAELRLEVVGGARTEAPLAYLTRPEAVALRARLLDLAAQAKGAAVATPDGLAGPEAAAAGTAAAPVAPGAGAVARENVVYQVRNRDLFLSQLLRPVWWVLPVGIAVPVVDGILDGEVGFVGIASTVTAVVGVLQAPMRALFGDWGFILATAPDGLRIRRGLLETRNTTVPEGRVQSIVVEWPRMWRWAGWVRASMHVAGVRVQEGQPLPSSVLPVGTVDQAESVIGHALPGVTLRSIAVQPVPRRARWFAPFSWRVLGFYLGPTVFASRDGLIKRRLVMVPYERIQSVRIRQGPLQRRLRLASVFVDVAGGGALAASAAAVHVDVGVAAPLARELAERSRAARRAR